MKGDANHRLKVDVQRIELRKIGESMERRHRFVFSLLEELYDRLHSILAENASRPIHHESRAGMEPNVGWQGYFHQVSGPSAHRAATHYYPFATAGKRKEKSAPPSGAFSALIFPPWVSMMERTMVRPMPMPAGLVGKQWSTT